jgi:uncharacterized delta-60 repeat protein
MRAPRPTRLLSVLAIAAAVSACGDDNDNDPAVSASPQPTTAPAPATPAAPGSLTVASDSVATAAQANDLRGVTFASNGKIYVSGHVGAATGDRQTVIGRYHADGTLDTGFGSGGWVTTNVAVKDAANPTSTGDEQAPSIVELANGDVIVAVNAADGNGGAAIGTSTVRRPEGLSVVLLRFTSTGAPVATFGSNGKASVDFGWTTADDRDFPEPPLNAEGTALATGRTGYPRDTFWNIALDPSGGPNERIAVFGFGPSARSGGGTQRFDNDRYVARVLATTGAADPAFNAGQPFTFATPGLFGDNARNGFVEPDGKILSAGYSNLGSGEGNHVILFRLTPAGTIDSTFSGFSTNPLVPATPGVAVFNPFKVDGGFAECYGAARQTDGSYVTTGYGGATAVTTPPTASTLGYQSTLMPDLVTFRVRNGALDLTWGEKANGTQAIQSEGKNRTTTEERGRAAVALADDRVVEVGRYGGAPAIYVFDRNGKLDPRADVGATEASGATVGDGILELSHATVGAQFYSAALAPGGKRVAVTTNADDNGARLVVLNVN